MGVRPYPLPLEPILLEKVWGGSRLAVLGKPCPPGRCIGESWELADLASTSSSGAGGGPARSRIASGPLAGQTLRDAIALWGRELTGDIDLTPDGGFPLLVKFLDARDNLSVQVHPSPAYAAAHADCHLKTEAWYIVDAEPSAIIYKGVKPGISAREFARHAREGRIIEDLIAVPAIRGDCHVLPSGTCHALGAGILVAEIQSPSDSTFRLYDWGRSGRELHLDAALECVEIGPAPAATRRPDARSWARLARTDSFDLFEFWTPRARRTIRDYRAHQRPTVIMVLEGSIRIGGLQAGPGTTLLVPARTNAALSAEADTRLLVAIVKGSRAVAPDLAQG